MNKMDRVNTFVISPRDMKVQGNFHQAVKDYMSNFQSFWIYKSTLTLTLISPRIFSYLFSLFVLYFSFFLSSHYRIIIL
jgi:hypothetical protein